ncbi:OmpP1/FadL family transporter [Rhodomicrobium lacus]|uniref:OmpP1/FadL family transporter n=1 Tax=Rhodomicrobium lacus TaxID=2498452 RepID=UPI0026E2A82E|nr:outer membrane protein transport protein [Rhodomicrobium lacus]WKW50226.1 outer membrane protein transport protein [Rhodomicrobium lacus]
MSFQNKMSGAIPALFAAAVALSAPASATEGYFFNGYGIQAEGIGGASIAYPKDAVAIASNPASALFLGNRFDVGAEWFRPDRSATITGNGYGLNGNYDGNARQDYLIPQVGYVTQVTPDLALGIAAYGNGLGSSYKKNPFFSNQTTGFSFEQFFISPTAAYQIAPGHSIGVSVNLAYQRFSAKGLTGFAASSSEPLSLTNKGTDEAFGIGARIGYQGHVSDRLTIGATYASETAFQDFKAYSGLLADQGGFNAPQNFGVGFAYKLTPRVDLTGEYQFINYSSINAVGNAGLTTLFSGKALGSSDGPGFNWKDANVFRIGANWQATQQLQLRAGYAYTNQVIREEETFLNILAPATVQSHFTAGFTWESASKKWEYSGYAFYAPETEVKGHNSLAAFGGGEANIRLSEVAVGFAIGYKFDEPKRYKD